MAAMAFELLVSLACIIAYTIYRRRHPGSFTCVIPLMTATTWVLERACVQTAQAPRLGAAIIVITICWWCAGSLALHICTSMRTRGPSLIACLGCVLALCIVACSLALPVAMGAKWHGAALFCANALHACGLWFSLSIAALDRYAHTHQCSPKDYVDAIIVPGAALRGSRPSPFLTSRLERALELWREQGCCAHIVVSGGQGADECVSEASAMHRYLAERGVPDGLIIDESHSTTTKENMRYSRQLIEEHLGARTRVAVVSTDYHLPRCAMFAASEGLDAVSVGASSAHRAWSRGYIREAAALTRAILPTYGIPILIALVCMP